MINRYAREEMKSLWTPQVKYRIFLEIELYACEAMSQLGLVPKHIPPLLWERARLLTFDADAIAEIEKIEEETKHDFFSFLIYLERKLGQEARYLHRGLTTSDIQDTAMSVLIKKSGGVLLESFDALLEALKKQALKHKKTICVGRTHGIHAEPLTFGSKILSYYAEFQRQKKRIANAVEEISICSLSGAVGTYAHIDPFVEKYVAEKLGLTPETISTQVIPRDRHAVYFARLGIMAGSVERLATEIRALQRTEIGEVAEYFGKGQKGSSAMPHKRNPILSENLVGLSRFIRGMAVPILENICLWHERDISHSSVERLIFPDANILSDFALRRLADIIENLLVFPERMRRNLDMLGGLIYSQGVLVSLVDAGVSREEAHAHVQTCVQKHMEKLEDAPLEKRDARMFLETLKEHEIINRTLGIEKLEACFEPENYLKNIDLIYERVLS